MILTQGEKMVWAAAFVARIERDKREELYDERSGRRAADAAGAAVQTLRDATPVCEERLEKDRLQMLHAMLEDNQ
jgi:hypothetical protein